MGAALKLLLGNPVVILGLIIGLGVSHGVAYWQGRSDGSAHEALKCEARVSKLQGEYAEQAKRIDELNRVWKEALDALIEGEAQRAKDRQAELDAANAKIEEYEKQLVSGDKAKCLLDKSDVDSVR